MLGPPSPADAFWLQPYTPVPGILEPFLDAPFQQSSNTLVAAAVAAVESYLKLTLVFVVDSHPACPLGQTEA